MFFKNIKMIVLIFVAFLSAGFYAPASLLIGILGPRGESNLDFHYSYIQGRLWKGHINDVALGGNYVGRVHYKLSLLSLLRGRAKLNLNFVGGGITGNSIFILGRNTYELKETDVKIELAQLQAITAFGEPLGGIADIGIKSLKMKDGICTHAFGNFSSDFIKPMARRLRQDDFLLSGPIECIDDKLALTLEGQGRENAVKLNFLLDQDLAYDVQAEVIAARADIVAALQIVGFEKSENGLRLQSQGVLKEIDQ